MADLKDILGSGLDDSVWTDERAAELDNISQILADTAAMDGRLMDARAGYLDNIPAILADTDAMDARINATRAGHLDSVPDILADTAALDGRLTDARAAALDSMLTGTIKSKQSYFGYVSSSTTDFYYKDTFMYLPKATTDASKVVMIASNGGYGALHDYNASNWQVRLYVPKTNGPAYAHIDVYEFY
jgi:hypothetical protein